METKQETKSLPRNRKCGNCRYFEPAPLWRKGWCRNPRLYDRRANHLVDASTIDCEQVFRARIYWEPVPTPEMGEEIQGNISPFSGINPADAGVNSADGGRTPRVPTDGILRPAVTTKQPLINRVISREKTAALPSLVKKPSNARKWLLENIPYYDKVDGPISRINWMIAIPSLIIGLAVLIILLNVLGGGKKSDLSSNAGANGTGTPASTTVSDIAAIPALTTASSTLDPKLATPTLSNALPTATPEPAKTTTSATDQRAKVVNTGTSKSLNLRKDTSTKDDKNILVRVPEGETVTIIGAPRFAEGIEWWQINYKGQVGWASKDYLQKIS